jgi:MtaA/CmuA family methyltransferase
MTNSLTTLMESCKKGNRAVFNGGPFLCIELMHRKGLSFSDILIKPEAMAAAALLNFDLGFDAAVLPFDLNVEAEILGAEVRYHDSVDGIPVYPTVVDKIVRTAEDIVIPENIAEKERLPAILECVRIMKGAGAGKGAVGVFIPGPFTLAGQVMDMDEMFVMVLKKPDITENIFRRLAEFIIALRDAYVDAGVDFIVFEEGGATTISPKAFRKLLLPHLQKILSRKAVPHTLSLTGSSDKYIELMLECRPDGIGVDQECDIDRVRQVVPGSIPLFAVCGTYDMLANSTPGEIATTVTGYLDKGVTCVLPPPDIYPPAKLENIEAFVNTARQYKG